MSVFDGVLEQPAAVPTGGSVFDVVPYTNATGQSVVTPVGAPMPVAPGDEEDVEPEDSGRSAMELGTDPFKSVAKGINTLGRGVTEGLNWLDEITQNKPPENIPTQPREETITGQAFEGVSNFFKGNEDYWENAKSEKLREMRQVRDQEVADADGFMNSAKAMASNPTALFDDLLGMGPELIAGGTFAQSLKGLSALGKIVAASGFSGVAEAGRVNEEVKDKLFAMSDEQWAKNPDFAQLMAEGAPVEQAKREVSRDYANRVAAVTATAVTVTGAMPLMNQMNKIITGVAAREMVEQGFDSAITAAAKGMAKGFVGEGLQESSSGAISDVAKNVALGSVDGTTGIFDRVAENAGANFTAGAAMGTAAGSFSGLGAGAERQRRADEETQRVQTEEVATRQAAQEREQQMERNVDVPAVDPRFARPEDTSVPDPREDNDPSFQRPEPEAPLDTSELDDIEDRIQRHAADRERAQGLTDLPVSDKIRSEFEEFYGEPFKEEPSANMTIEARRFLLRDKREQNKRLAEKTGVEPSKFVEDRERVSADYQARRENQKAVTRSEQELDKLLKERERVKANLFGEPAQTPTPASLPNEGSAADAKYKRPASKKPEFVDQYWLKEDGEWVTDDNGQYIETDKQGNPLSEEEVQSNAFINSLAEQAEIQEELDLEAMVSSAQKEVDAAAEAKKPKSLNTRIEDALGEINSATAGSQAKRSVQSTRDISNESRPSRDSVQGDSGINPNLGQQEVNTPSSRLSEAESARSDQEGAVPEEGLPDESGLVTGSSPDRGTRIEDQPRRGQVRAATEVERARVREAATRLNQKSNGRVELFDTVDKLSTSQSKAVKARSKTGDGKDVPAFYDPSTDRIYINPDLVKSQSDLRALTAHEAVHAGLRDQYGSEDAVKGAMLDLLGVMGNTDFVKAKAKSLGIPVKQYLEDPKNVTLDDVAALVEEIVARTRQGQVGKRKNALQRLMGNIRDWLNKFGVEVPYLGPDKANLAVAKTLRRAQRAYDRATQKSTYPPTIGDQAANADTAATRSRIVANVRKSHDLAQEQETDVPDDLAHLISNHLSGETRAQRQTVADRRLQYSLSPRHLFSMGRAKTGRNKWKEAIKREMFPESIVGPIVADMKDLTEAQKNGDRSDVEFMLQRFNGVFDNLKLKGDDELKMFRIIQAHLTDSVNPMIHVDLQDAASRIRSFEITSEDAAKHMATRNLDSIPDSVRDAFEVLRDRDGEFDVADKASAAAFVTGQVEPSVPKALISPMQDMRAHIDNHSGRIMEMISEQISDRVARLSDGSWSVYQDYMGINSTEGRIHTNRVTGERLKYLEEDGTVNWDRMAETGDIPKHLASLHNLHDTISGNMGKYLNSSYEAFENPDWYDLVLNDDALMERAISELKKERTAEFMGKLSDEDFSLYQDYLESDGLNGDLPKHFDDFLTMTSDKRIRNDIGAILEAARDANSMMNLFTDKSIYGAKDLSILKKKKNLSPIIRELLGEYQDPRVNFVKSSHRMINYVAKQEFLNGLAQELTGSVLWHTTDDLAGTDFHTKLGDKDSDSMNPIAGMYTSREFRDALADWAKPAGTDNEAARIYHLVNGTIKIGKTVYNPGTHVANLGSSALIATMNGHVNPAHYGMPIRMWAAEVFGDNPIGRIFSGGGKEGYQAFMELKSDLIRRGVLLDSINAGETEALMSDMQTSKDTLFKWMMKTRMGKVLGWADTKVKLMYQWEDDFFKMAGYLHEVEHNQKKRNMDDETAKITAAERIRNTYPTYSKIPPAIQKVRRAFMMGDFVSFSSEIVRITYNQKKYIEEDWKSDKSKVAMRVVGAAVAMSALQTAAYVSRIKHGIDDEDDETNRQMFSPWTKFGTILYLGQNENGQMEYVDLSRFDPWSMFRKMYNGATNGYNETMYHRMKEFATQALEPFLAPSMLATAAGDVAYNSRYSRPGLDIANPQQTDGERMKAYGEYIYRALAPGFLTSIERFRKAKNGDVSFSGKQFTTEDEWWGLAGVRKNTLNLATATTQQGGLLSTSVRDSQDIANGVLRDQAIYTPEKIEKYFNSMMKARDRNYFNALRMIESLRDKNVADEDIAAQFQIGGNSKKTMQLLLRGQIPEYNMTDRTAASALAKALMGAGNDEALVAQLTQRFEFKKELIRTLTDQYYANASNATTTRMNKLIEQKKYTVGAAPASTGRPTRDKRQARAQRAQRAVRN